MGDIVGIDGNDINGPKSIVIDPRLTHIGRFGIPMIMLRQEFEVVQALLRNIVVLAAETNKETDVIEYTGISPNLFDSVQEGHMIPVYNIGQRIDGIWEFHRRD
jgi:hypothetical protein